MRRKLPAIRINSEGLRSAGGDIAGSVGNFGTILPLFVAVSVTTGMSLSLMLLLCGGWYILTGIIYRIPIPVEPLKAVAAVSIAGHLNPTIIAASGIMTGFLFLILGFSGGMGWIREKIPVSVIRGIQLGLGLLLLKSAILDFGIDDIFFFAICIVIIALFLILKTRIAVPDLSALLILFIGAGAGIIAGGIPSFHLPVFPEITLPILPDYVAAGMDLVLPQIPLTIANAILATSLLVTELYHRPVSPDHLSITIGTMSLTSSLLGGFPLCHGAGGVAAHYRFGARTGSAMIIGGIILIGLSTLLTDPAVISTLPRGMFGALLLAVSIELISHGWKTDNRLVSGSMAIIAIPAGMTIAFIAGIGISYGSLLKKRKHE